MLLYMMLDLHMGECAYNMLKTLDVDCNNRRTALLYETAGYLSGEAAGILGR